MKNIGEISKQIEMQDCPICHGTGILEEEEAWCVYAQCLDCGCHTAEIPFSNEEEKINAARSAAHLWNIGKVLSHSPGE